MKQTKIFQSRRNVRWKRGEMLGQGAFGVVYLGLNVETGQLTAFLNTSAYSMSQPVIIMIIITIITMIIITIITIMMITTITIAIMKTMIITIITMMTTIISMTPLLMPTLIIPLLQGS